MKSNLGENSFLFFHPPCQLSSSGKRPCTIPHITKSFQAGQRRMPRAFGSYVNCRWGSWLKCAESISELYPFERTQCQTVGRYRRTITARGGTLGENQR